MGDDQVADDRLYGLRYAESAGEDLYRVAGRILSDLKVDQHEDRLPASAVFVIVVEETTITVKVHVQSDADIEQWSTPSIRARVYAIGDRYNWRGRDNRADMRFKVQAECRIVRGRLDAALVGSMIG